MQPLSIVRIDVQGVKADAAEVDALARLALRLRRCGCQLMLLSPSEELLELIELCGLGKALPADRPSSRSTRTDG